MELFKLLSHLEYDVIQGSTEREVKKVTNDSRNVEAEDVFVCVAGYLKDGHDYIQMAIQRGAVAIVLEREDYAVADEGIVVIKVKDTRVALAMMAAESYGNPAKELTLIGITGTKGKTTVAYMLYQMLNAFGYKTGLIGTVSIDTGGEIYTNQNTTPESLDIQRYLYEMKQSGCQYGIMEVSSQGIKLKRIAGISFEIGIFTNLGEDHLGLYEHKNLEEYKECKKQLFYSCKAAIGNLDDKACQEMFLGTTCKKITYGIRVKEADFIAGNIHLCEKKEALGSCYNCKEGNQLHKIFLPVPGEFNVYNSLATIAALRYLSFSYTQIVKGFECVSVPGRMEKIGDFKDCMLYIDYAHNGMSLKSVLETFRSYEPKRLVVIFGCGGNRAKERRSEMGKAAGEGADLTIITTDNPRYESPLRIIKDIENGIKKTKASYQIIPDRKEAIRFAIRNREKGDIILIAGKGHETYQEINGVRLNMDDRQLIDEIIQEMNNENNR